MFTPLSISSVKPRSYFSNANLFLEKIQNTKWRMTQRQTEWKEGLKSESEVKWNRWKKRDEREEKRGREVMGSGAVPGFYWRLGLALARRDKREIIIRPAEAWQPLLGTAMRQTERCVRDWPCHRWRLLDTQWHLKFHLTVKNSLQQAAPYLHDWCLGEKQDFI